MSSHPPTAPRGYPTAARWLHWITALVVLLTIPAGVIMVTEGISRPLQNALFLFHKNVGVVILILVILRLAIKLGPAKPDPLPASIPDWQQKASAVSHVALYLLLIVMAVSGYIRVVAGGFPIEMLNAINAPALVPRSDALAETAKSVHYWARYGLVAFVLLHVGAALQHGLIKRDGVFGRMWPPTSRS
jgi:cytochrome b561